MPKITGSPSLSPTQSHDPETDSANTASKAPTAMLPARGELAGLRPFARACYEDMRYYHGTSPAGRDSIQEHGMLMSAKQPGAMQKAIEMYGVDGSVPGAAEQANRAHHLTTDPKLAWQYSGAQGHGRAVARVLIKDPEAAGLRPDPFSKAGSGALITEQDIPASSVLGSKKARSGRGREVFQERFNEAVDEAMEWSDEALLNETGFIKRDLRKINKEEAGILIDDVQSDSEDDGD